MGIGSNAVWGRPEDAPIIFEFHQLALKFGQVISSLTD
jgi:hypothetical protein